MNSAIVELEQVAAQYLVQREPYPVAAPDRVEVIPKILEAAAKSKQKVLVFGTGSSFGREYSLLRDNVIAVTMAGISGIERTDPFSFKVLAGTPLKDVLRVDGGAYKGSVGGFLARNLTGPEREARRLFLSRIRSIDVVDGQGRFRTIPGPARNSAAAGVGLEQLAGSTGRLAVIASIELAIQPPVEVQLPRDATTQMSLASAGRPAIGREAAGAELDSYEIFKW